MNKEKPEALRDLHLFWHGAALTRVERLCMASMAAQGHCVRLHSYDEVADIPPGIELCDARDIIPQSQLFHHERSGSITAFADWFRYRVLYELGGIWMDADVVCLQPLSYPQSEIYAWQDTDTINNAVLGLPAGDALAGWMAESCERPNRWLPYDDLRTRWRKLRRRFRHGNRRGNIAWGEYGPYGFTQAARHLGYAAKALPPVDFYPVPWTEWHRIFEPGAIDAERLQRESRAIHLWNEMLRREPGFDKNARFPDDSLFEQLCRRYLTSDS